MWNEPWCCCALAVALEPGSRQRRAATWRRNSIRRRVYLELEPGRTGAELELWSLRKEADYFREVFGRELFATVA